MAEETVNPTELSKEELAERRREIKEYYEDNIPSLKVQLEYETILRDIEKARAERLQAQMFVAQTMAGPSESDDMPQDPRSQGKVAAEQMKAQMKMQAEAAINTDKKARTLKKAK
tara:strand:- start:486 stop:830 length:345 start_codon:yes stop_codon:yes gene_type:complete